MAPANGAPEPAQESAWEHAHAKINLFLHVTGRRDDGYHLLDSLAVFAGAADRLRVSPDTQLRLSLSGPFSPGLLDDAGDNLVLRAARLLADLHPDGEDGPAPGAHLWLEKHLPVASGMGGGSADAAAALRLLRRAWSLDHVDDARLHDLARSLGADVPVCLAQQPRRMQGVGELLGAAPELPQIGMVLINCGEAVATPDVFRARDPHFSLPAELPHGWPDAASLAASLTLLSNDLEAAACRICPTIDRVLASLRDLPGCLFARMSGSGATCFGLFDSPEAAGRAVRGANLPAAWWVWAGGLHHSA